MRCPNCGSEASEQALQCTICGAPLRSGDPRNLAAVSASGTVGSGAPQYPPPPPPLYPPLAQPAARCLACGAAIPIGSVQCPACGSNASIFGHAPRRANRRWPIVVAVLGGVVAAAAVAVVAFLLFTSDDGPSYPSHWDARVAPITTRVEELRGLTFQHPVTINYLSDAEFEKRLTSTPAENKKQRQEIADVTALFRAVGFIGDKVDLFDAMNDTQTADTLAYYDEQTKQIYVRGGGAFTVETRVTLAHELTHVLQDQHFDLRKLHKRADDSKTGSSDALTAIVEGDADRIEHLYLNQQTAADRGEYARLSAQGSDQAGERTKDVPAVVGAYFGAPYVYGPEVVRVLETSGGNAAINAALTGPALTTRLYFDPTATGEGQLPPNIPALKPGEEKLSSVAGDDGKFDAFTLYLMLGTRLDGPTALRAADAFSAGSEVMYRRAGVTCFRGAITGNTAAGNAFLRTAVGRWVAKMPDAAIDTAGPPLEFHTCDGGARATTPSATVIKQATALAAGRDEIVASFVAQHIPSDLASCAARLLVTHADVRDDIVHNTSKTPRTRVFQYAATAGQACRANPEAGLP